MKPRIAIPLPTSFDHEYNRLNFPAYADCVVASGGDPVEVALGSSLEAGRLASGCNGILLPGSPADVDPATYGQPRDATTADGDLQREQVDRVLLEQAWQTGKPVLGICFGLQVLNVFCGGTLVQDLSVLPVNHAAGRPVAVAHAIAIEPDSLLERIADAAEVSMVNGQMRLPVNSSHHQAVGIVGGELHVIARCAQDGVVEAIEGSGPAFRLGVQWHPERTFRASASSRALFASLLAEAAIWRAANVPTVVI